MFSTDCSVASRREFLQRAGCGFGALAFSYLLGLDGLAARAGGLAAANPLLPKTPHFPGKARAVIWLFMEGGPSHIDLFDPKPELDRLAGQPMPESFGRPITAMGTANNTLMPSKRKWKQHGQSGLWISDWFPRVAEHADDLCVIRSCWADGLNHVGSVCQMNTGDILAGRPSMGAWSIYGLGTANQNLPAFVILTDYGEVNGGPKNWSSGFLPAVYQGTQFRNEGAPIYHLDPPATISERQQRSKLDLLANLNRHFAADKPDETELNARLNSYELAWRMQTAAPEAVDLASESEATRRLYGLDRTETEKFGRNLLLARSNAAFASFSVIPEAAIFGTPTPTSRATTASTAGRPTSRIAGLLTDLRARGLLDSTLVIWGGEFGRTPFNEKGDGRDHNPWGFTVWMAGGGIRGGTVVGATDEIGLRAVEKRAHVHDLHATILHQLGLDHERLTWLHNGRDERPTINGGAVIAEAVV